MNAPRMMRVQRLHIDGATCFRDAFRHGNTAAKQSPASAVALAYFSSGASPIPTIFDDALNFLWSEDVESPSTLYPFFEQRDARVEFVAQMQRQPNLIGHAGALKCKLRSFVYPGQHPSDRCRVQRFDMQLRQLQIRFVNPHAPVKFRKKLRIFFVRLKARTRFAIDYPCLPPVDQLSPHQSEVVGVGHFAYKLALFVTGFGLFLLPLAAFLVRFVLMLVDDLLDLFLFFRRLLASSGLSSF